MGRISVIYTYDHYYHEPDWRFFQNWETTLSKAGQYAQQIKGIVSIYAGKWSSDGELLVDRDNVLHTFNYEHLQDW